MRNRRLAIAVTALALLSATAPAVRAAAPAIAHADSWTARPATYGVAVTKDVLITMSDGAELAADIHRPALADGTPAPGQFPVLLVQTPYNKNEQSPANDYLVQRGYVDVIVDIRGTGSSEGVFDQTFSTRSQLDGKELVHWAATQPWSTGNVGLHGESYYAINQLLTAAQQPPELKAIFPVVPTGDNYRTNFPGGYLTSLFVFSLLYASDGATPPGYAASDPGEALRTMGSRPASVVLQTENSAGLLSGDDKTYDGPQYHAESPLWLLDRITTPTFLAGGWYDALSQRDAPMLFHELQARHVPVKLLMGPWYHTTAGSDLPTGGVASLDELQLRWFDHWVRGDRDRGLDNLGPVIYNRLGTGTYETAPTWPVPGIDYRNAYLGGTSTPGTTGTLGNAPGGGGPDVLPWQPASGACTRSTYIGTFGLAPSTPCETNDTANDLTGLTYDLDVPQTLDLTGPMSAHLYVSTSTTDAFVTLHLEDVDPTSGTATEITSGWDSLVFRQLDTERSTKVGDNYVIPFHPDTKESVQPATAGVPYEWWIEIRPAAATIAAGHKLRLSIQTSDTVRFLPTASRAAATAGSVLSVYHDADHPSSLVLPFTR
jgi:putative CocE/NonD family hydrolase